MTNFLTSKRKVPAGGVLELALVTPEPATAEQIQQFGQLVEAVETSKLVEQPFVSTRGDADGD